jgi:hypothetical protein
LALAKKILEREGLDFERMAQMELALREDKQAVAEIMTEKEEIIEVATLSPQFSTLNPQPSTLNPYPLAQGKGRNHRSSHPKPSTLSPQPSALNPQPSTLNPYPLAQGKRRNHRSSHTPNPSTPNLES